MSRFHIRVVLFSGDYSAFGFAASRSSRSSRPSRLYGFTLIELLVVLSIIALLLTLAVPRYFHSTDRAREAVLRQDLSQMREAIDKYYGDRGSYPDTLEDLVQKRYLRSIPADPMTETPLTWVTVPAGETGKGSVFDVKSGAPGVGLDGTPFTSW